MDAIIKVQQDILEDFKYLCKQYIAVDAEHSLNLSTKIRKN